MKPVAWIAVVGVLLVACSREDGPPSGGPDHGVFFQRTSGGEAVLHVWVADSDAERQRGLMGVDDLGADQGMAFVFDDPTDTTFWMKDTPLPLSIAFVDDSGTIVGVREMAPCHADPCPTYAARSPFVMAVEANAGYFEREQIGVGDRARLAETARG